MTESCEEGVELESELAGDGGGGVVGVDSVEATGTVITLSVSLLWALIA